MIASVQPSVEASSNSGARRAIAQSVLNLSFTLHGRTTRVTGGAMRESFPARFGVLPLATRAFPVGGGCWAEPPIPFPGNVLAPASRP